VQPRRAAPGRADLHRLHAATSARCRAAWARSTPYSALPRRCRRSCGQELAKPEPVPETPVVDLMEALKRSVAEGHGRKKAAPSTKRKAAAKGSGQRAAAPWRASPP